MATDGPRGARVQSRLAVTLTRAARSTGEAAMQRHTGVSWGVWESLSPPPSLGPQLSLNLKSQVFHSLPVLRRTPFPWCTHAADGSARPQDGAAFLRGPGGRRCRLGAEETQLQWGQHGPPQTSNKTQASHPIALRRCLQRWGHKTSTYKELLKVNFDRNL